MKNKIILVAILIISTISAISAQDPVKKPRSKQIALIGSCVITTPVKEDFYARYFDYTRKTQAHAVWFSPEGIFSVPRHVGNIGDMFYILVDIPKDGVLKLDSLRLALFNSSWATITLPVNIEITIPEGQNICISVHLPMLFLICFLLFQA
jgi:hypothetical protein